MVACNSKQYIFFLFSKLTNQIYLAVNIEIILKFVILSPVTPENLKLIRICTRFYLKYISTTTRIVRSMYITKFYPQICKNSPHKILFL